MTRPDPTKDPALRLCNLLISWLNGVTEDLSEKELIEKLQSIFRSSDITGPSGIIRELRRHGDLLDGCPLKYEFTAAGPELDGASIRKIIKRVKQARGHSAGNSAKSGPHRSEERPCV